MQGVCGSVWRVCCGVAVVDCVCFCFLFGGRAWVFVLGLALYVVDVFFVVCVWGAVQLPVLRSPFASGVVAGLGLAFCFGGRVWVCVWGAEQ